MKSTTTLRVAALLAASALSLAGCAASESPVDSEAMPDSQASATGEATSEAETGENHEDDHSHDQEGITEGGASLISGDFLSNYVLEDESFGTITTVTLMGSMRQIETNALPNHETGEFPNPNNPNAISAQDNTWVFPIEGTYTGQPQSVKVTGVALNGVKFDPNTAERVNCESGETYNLEALQDISDLGLDFNNAHVQPGGEYHYHGVSSLLVNIYDQGDDLVHVGFAADGNLIYYSKSGAYESSYQILDGERSGTNCTYQAPLGGDVQEFGSVRDGSLAQDWEFSAAIGDLDQCNGTEINGEYSYLLTDTYPFVPRCLMGEFTEDTSPPELPSQDGGGLLPPPDGMAPDGPPPGDAPPRRP